jgi:hypothetical protein
MVHVGQDGILRRVVNPPGRLLITFQTPSSLRRHRISSARRFHIPIDCGNELMRELVFEVTQESDGGFCAECLTVDIFTEADTWEELRENVREAVRAYFFDSSAPQRIRLHLVKDETLALQ